MIDKSEKFTWLVRTGYAARGLVYVLLGYLALSSAEAAKGGPEAAFDVIQAIPLGTLILYLVTAGLFAYAAYKFLCALSDLENNGSDAKGIAKRIGYFASGIAHAALSWTALKFAGGDKQAPEGTAGGQQAAGTLLSWDLGGVVVGLVGLGFVVGAGMQARSAVNAHFMHNVANAPSVVGWLGRGGHAARSVVFLIIGWSLIQSAWIGGGPGVKGLGEALVSLRDNGFLYTLVAIGMIMFGVFSLVVARYRIIPDVHAGDLKPNV